MMQQRIRLSVLLVCTAAGAIACGWVPGCAAPDPQINAARGATSSQRPNRESSSKAEPSALLERPPQVLVIAARCSVPEDTVESEMQTALARREMQTLDVWHAEDADAVLLVAARVRQTAQWGNMPSCELVLRYVLLDARSQRVLAQDQATAGSSELTAEAATMTALKAATGEAAGRALRAVAEIDLPPVRTAPNRLDEPATEGRLPTVACLPFLNKTKRADLDGWCRALPSLAAQELRRTGRYRLVEWDRLADVLKEKDLRSVLGGDADAARVMGGRFHADLLLLGEVAFLPDKRCSITARLVRTADAQYEPFNASDRDYQAAERVFLRRLSKPIPPWVEKHLTGLCP
jgi:hypothetical protein